MTKFEKDTIDAFKRMSKAIQELRSSIAVLEGSVAQINEQGRRIKYLEDSIKAIEAWKDKQPVWTQIDGEWKIVPSCFD